MDWEQGPTDGDKTNMKKTERRRRGEERRNFHLTTFTVWSHDPETIRLSPRVWLQSTAYTCTHVTVRTPLCVSVCVWACVRYLLCVFFGHPQWSTVIGCIPQLEAAIAAACHQNVLISFTPCHVEQAVTPLPAETHTRGWHKNLIFDPWLNSCFLYSTLKDYFWDF